MSNNALELKQELLRLLDQDYHQTHEQLARQLGTETSQVAKMIRELEDDRILSNANRSSTGKKPAWKMCRR